MRGGNAAAAAIIYRNEGNRLRLFAQRIVHNYERADDVVHDAFVQILRDAASFDPRLGSARAWIYAVVRNIALKSCRRANREVPVDNESLFALWTCERTPATESHVADYADLRNCLEVLEPQRRASLILAIVDGRTHAEIAAYLGVPIGTVKSWIRRELVTLRRHFGGADRAAPDG